MRNLRHRLEEGRKNSISDRERFAGNTFATKVTQRVEMGWLNFESGTYHQIRTRNGGVTRHLSVQKSITMGELLQTGKDLFFPNGRSSKGLMEDFDIDIHDYSHVIVSPEVTVGQLYDQTKLRMLRVYVSSKAKNVTLISDESSDSEPTERPKTSRKMQRRSSRNKTRRSPAPSGSMQRAEPIIESRPRPATPEMSDAEFLHQLSSDDPDSHTQQPTSVESESPLAFAIEASLEDSEVNFGPNTGDDDADQDSTLPWNPDDLDPHTLH
ncbi:uncharacterized protein LOC132874766 [Neoarius graeffei]|uniref:uncharacterized protein LOC132874766 n=1 Tax=Neoarius graeffei TaxID=443677 RepID=UPI00298BD239|nr:uncharacterized protein LOC132874766 [Neoarius graeffei]